MKPLFHLFLLLLLINANHSVYSANKDSISVKRFSVGVTTAPVMLTLWQLHTQNDKTLPQRTNLNFFYPSYLSLEYELNNSISLRCEIGYNKERYSFSNDYGYGNTHTSYLDMDYKKEYFSVPIGIRFFPNKTIKNGGFYIQLMTNFDFISKENINYSLTETSGSGPLGPTLPPNFHDPAYSEFHSYKIRYDRVCPTLSFGHEIIRRRFTFFYASYLEFSPLYKRKTTQPFYYNNIKFSLLNIGASYRF